MGKKCSNEARMSGVLPSQGADPIPVGKIPDGATQVAKQIDAENTPVIVHTVDTDKTLYLNAIALSGHNSNAAARGFYLFVRNDSDYLQYYFWVIQLAQYGSLGVSLSFPTPLEIPEKWDICVETDGADATGYGFVHGYEM